MKRGHRFLAASLGAAAAVSAAGGVASRLARRRADHEDDLLGSIRGETLAIRGPRASRIYVERFPGERGTVVFTHGWCLSEAVWHHQKAALSAAGWEVVTWDLPGHGASSPVARGHLTLELATDALARVVEHVAGPAGVVLVGHSLGGVLTLSYLAGREEPAPVRGAVFVATPLMHFARSIAGRWPGAGIEAKTIGSLMERVVSNPRLDRMFADGVAAGTDQTMSYRVVRVGFGRRPSPDHIRFIRDMIASVSPGVRVDTYRAMTGYDLSRAVPGISVPSLVITGGRDRLVNPAESHLLASLLPRAREVVFPDAGHAVFLEEHERFDRELARFLDRRFSPRKAGTGSGTARGGKWNGGRARTTGRSPSPVKARTPGASPDGGRRKSAIPARPATRSKPTPSHA